MLWNKAHKDDATESSGVNRYPTALHEGDVLCDSRIVRLLGRGGMGEVWLVQSRAHGSVACKVLDAASSADPQMRKRFLREGQLMLGVKHPNLVETYDVGEDKERGICYILMEYVPGGTLADRLADKGRFAIGDALALVKAIANVLELAQSKSIVHRDIKPGNIMFDAHGTPKLADLGIARNTANVGVTTVTQTGMMIGTPAYMAPEQMVNAHTVDGRADIYSLGIVLFEMLTGERPNKEYTTLQLMARTIKGEPLPDVRKIRSEVPVSVTQLLSMMTAKDPASRIPTAKRVIELIGEIEGGATFLKIAPVTQNRTVALPPRFQPPQATSYQAPQPRKPKQPETKRGGGCLPIALVLLLAGLGAAGYMWYREYANKPKPESSAPVRVSQPEQSSKAEKPGEVKMRVY